MATSISKVTECPICLEKMVKPIIQCELGHSMCQRCTAGITTCPVCHRMISNTRNFGLEQLIESLDKTCKVKCDFTQKGCNYVIDARLKATHESECKYRKFKCEGQKFGSWYCTWSGDLDDIENHFRKSHKNKTWMKFKTEATMKVDLTHDFSDLQIINFNEGQRYFWYKHRIDLHKQKAFWTFQMIGTRQNAQNYYYEFEIYRGPTRKFKVSEICDNDVVNADEIFESERCVVVSFKTLKTFLNENHDLNFKFRIMSIKKHTTD